MSTLSCEKKTTSCVVATMRFAQRTSNIASSEKAAAETTLPLTGIPVSSRLKSRVWEFQQTGVANANSVQLAAGAVCRWHCVIELLRSCIHRGPCLFTHGGD